MDKVPNREEYLTKCRKELDHKATKLHWGLMPWAQLEEAVKVMDNGAKKYEAFGWRLEGKDTYKNAMVRHIVAYMKGEKNDKEDGLHHLAHAICNCLYCMWYDDQEVPLFKEEHNG